jgi:hypothetical protein
MGGEGGATGANGSAGLGGVGISGGDLTIFNSGTVTGGFANGGTGAQADAISFSGGTGNLTNVGTITGNVVMDGSFANTVTLFTGSTINGDLNMSSNAGSTLTLDGMGTQNFSAAVTGTTTFNGSVTKQGTGTWNLNLDLGYSGATNVIQGTLQVDGSIANSATTVQTGATLQGTGRLGNVTMMSGSTLMAGDSPAQLNNTLAVDNLVFNAGSTFQYKMNTSLGQGDTIAVNGNLSLNNVNLVLNDLSGSPRALAAGTQLTLFTYTGTESGEFDFDGKAVANDGLITFGDNTFEVQYGFGDPSVTLTAETDVAAVPEPGTWALLLGGLILLFCWRHPSVARRSMALGEARPRSCQVAATI